MNDNPQPPNIQTVTCEVCGAPWQVSALLHVERYYCSIACKLGEPLLKATD